MDGSVTEDFGKFIANTEFKDLSEVVVTRSKRMILDNIGVGLIGSQTEIADIGKESRVNYSIG